MVLGELIGLKAGANVRGFGTREKGFSEISLNVKFEILVSMIFES